ncbi:DNA repair protein RecO [Desulfuromonas versatilis]|uniref:DNA repair protein RecO n=1 Tax=Desulfuromonas versatilis TaxID=2802975 RepID=A0ABM8HZ29_9BACT|nr:DNA repair protein RecO [Desulfuromonas versatilis]BCR05968.1 DNA repair protein RecO [Desulfuromonas versatilis]
MHIHASEAIILRHIDYGEADRIVTFLTPEPGRLKGFARSARKSRRRFGAALEPFASVRLHWSAPRSGELVSLKEAELVDLRAGLRGDLAAFALAGYSCELVDVLLGEQQGHREVFDFLQACLDHLAAAGAGGEARLLVELRVLAMSGYVPHLLHCSECGGGFGGELVAFDASRGGSLCDPCAGAGPPHRVALGTLGSLARSLKVEPTRFAGFRFSPRTLAEGGAILGQALALHLPGALRSRPFLEEVLPC